MRFISSMVRAIFFLFILFAGIGMFPSIASIILFLLCILVLPIRSLQKAINRKFNIAGMKKVFLCIGLFVIALFVTPSAETTDISKNKNEIEKIDVSDSVEDEEIESTFSIQFLDVGQADASLIECDGHYMLIDGGNKSDSNKMYAILKEKGISHLDMIVGTHAHEDHIGGIPGALNYATADKVLCPTMDFESEAFKDFKKYATENGGGIIVPEIGDEYNIGVVSRVFRKLVCSPWRE